MADDRLDNPYTPGVAFEPAPKPSATTVIKLWSGGEHANAKALFGTLKLSKADAELVATSCLGWDD